MKLITIGIAVYNAEKYLKDAIQSVLNQSYKNFELIIVNDGSTDESIEIVKSFTDSRIKFFNDKENKGLIIRLNQLVKMAKGEYFVRMDSDDIMFPERIERQLLTMVESQADVTYSDAISINTKNQVLGIKKSRDIYNRNDIMSGFAPIHPTVMGKTSFFLNNPYSEGFTQMEDLELWYRTIEQYRFKTTPIPLLFYRENSTHNSAKHRKMIKSLKLFCEKYNFSVFQRTKTIVFSKIKQVTFQFLENLKMEDILLKRRYVGLDDRDKIIYQVKLQNCVENHGI